MAKYDITALDSALEFDTTAAQWVTTSKVPTKDWVAVGWYQSTTVILIQILNVNPTTGAVTALGSPVDVEAGTGVSAGISVVAIDATNMAVFWTGPSTDGFCQLYSIDGSGNLTANGSAVEYDTTEGQRPMGILWDSTHILLTWDGGDDGFEAQIFVFNTGAGTIAVVGSPLGVDNAIVQNGSLIQLDSTHALATWRINTNDIQAIVLAINNSTFAVTKAGADFAVYNPATIQPQTSASVLVSASPMVVAISWSNGVTATDTSIRTCDINTSTWAITHKGAALAVSASGSDGAQQGLQKVDADTLIIFHGGADRDGFASTLDYDSSTGTLTVIDTIEFDTSNYVGFGGVPSAIMSEDTFFCAWTGLDTDGYAQAFEVSLSSGGPANLKTYNTNVKANIKTINTNVIANVKTLNTNA